MAKRAVFILFLGLLCLGASTHAYAVGSGGFENASFSAIQIAQGGAVTAQGEEPAAISYNPAAIVDLPGIQVQHNSGFVSLLTFYDGDPHSRDDMRSSGTLSYVPTAYVTINPGSRFGFNDRLALGIGVDAPFGLSNKYDSTHPSVRYSSGASNWIKMYAVKPVVALRLTDKLSIGAGPVWYRVFGLGTVTQYANSSIIAGVRDGQLRINLKGNRWGWHAGAKYKMDDKNHFGFYFRSPVNINTRGELEVENAVSDLVGSVGTIRGTARAKLSIPMNFTFAYAHRPNDRTVIEADLGWTKWSNFSRLVVHPNDPVNLSAIGAINGGHDTLIRAFGKADTDFTDTFSLHLGGSYQATDKWTLRAGSYFYWTPLPKHAFRPNLPDSNSLAASIGVSYQMFENLAVDAAYLGRYWFAREIDNPISESLGTSVDGTYKSFAQQFILSARYTWDPFTRDEAYGIEKHRKAQQEQKENNVEDVFWQGLS